MRSSQSCEALGSLGTFAKSDNFLSYALCPGILGDLTGSLNTIQMQLSSFFLRLQFFGHFISRQVLLLNERQVNRLCLQIKKNSLGDTTLDGREVKLQASLSDLGAEED